MSVWNGGHRIYDYCFPSSSSSLSSSLLTHEKMLMDIEQILIFRYFVFPVKKKKNKLVWVGVGSEDGLGSKGSNGGTTMVGGTAMVGGAGGEVSW
jgi:hypothetical protein